MMIKAIVWDVGGVLLRTADITPRDALARELGMDHNELSNMVFGDDDDFRAQLGRITLAQHQANIAARLEVTESKAIAMMKTFFAGDVLDGALIDRIRAWHAQGYRTAVLSNYWAALRDEITQQWQIGDAFDHLIISAEVGFMKPAPAIYTHLLDTIEVAASEAVFLDDHPNNVAAAQQLGIHAIQFDNKAQAMRELDQLLSEQGAYA